MKAFKIIVIIVLFMSLFTLIMLPMDAGTFPAWLDTDLIGFMLMLLCAAFVIVMMRIR